MGVGGVSQQSPEDHQRPEQGQSVGDLILTT